MAATNAAEMVAEALAHAYAVTPEFSHPYRDSRVLTLGTLRTSNRVRQDVVDAALAHLAERCERTTDALVLARVETARVSGCTERALVAGEALLAQLTEAKERASRAEERAARANLRAAREETATLAALAEHNEEVVARKAAEERAEKAEAERDMAAYVARIDAEREIRRELKIEGIVLYRSLSSGTFVIRREGEGEWLVDEPTIEACVARGVALGLLVGPKKAEVPRV